MSEINYETFINNIGDLSKKYNMPRNKALIDSGVGKDFVTNISKGSAPSIDKIFKLADYFNVSIDYLLGLDTEPNRKIPLSEDKQRLLEMTTVELIQQKLEEKGIKPAKMSRDLGFSNGLFSQWKSGLQKPSADKIEKVAEYLGCSVDYLMGKEKSIYHELSEDKQRLLEMYDLLTEREQGEILGYGLQSLTSR